MAGCPSANSFTKAKSKLPQESIRQPSAGCKSLYPVPIAIAVLSAMTHSATSTKAVAYIAEVSTLAQIASKQVLGSLTTDGSKAKHNWDVVSQEPSVGSVVPPVVVLSKSIL